MAICLCGVCVPYSAILPFVVIVLQFVAAPLARMGLLPKFIEKKLGIVSSTKAKSSTDTSSSSCAEKSCCTENPDNRTESSVSSNASNIDVADSIMYEVKSSSHLQNLLETKEVVFLKFTAEWCNPCKNIQPLYHELATRYCKQDSMVAFATADVDEHEDIASEYKVGMMPTFVAIRGGDVIETMSGSNESKLEAFVKKVLKPQ